MKNLSIVAILLLLFFSFSVKSVLAGYPLIVEVQIAGEKSSDDFIKIYNPTNSDIYLGNYQGSYLRLVKRTKTSTKDYTIKSWSRDPGAKIPAGGFYLWANKDYTALSNVDAITSQTIAVNNGIALRSGPENTGLILDAVGWGDFNNILFEGSPFPENPIPNQRLERKKIAGVYQDTNNNSQDFYFNPPSKQALPEAEIPPQEKPQPELEPQPKEELKPEPTPIPYPFGILINEILPSPTGPDEAEEWIEIFNQNNEEIELSGWQIADTTGSINTYTFPAGTKISAQGFLVLSRPTTKITLNNDSDSLNLIQPNGKIIDSVTYGKAPRGQSYNRIDSQWVWSTVLTPGSKNIVPSPEEKKTEPKTETEKAEAEPPKVEESKAKRGMAAIGEQVPKGTPFFPPLLIALSLAIFSGIIILTLKRKMKNLDLSKKLE